MYYSDRLNKCRMVEVTKKGIVNNVLWNAVEKYSSQGISLLVSIVMARILTPAEYGIIGIISVFIGIANIFINSGIGKALIAKKDCSIVDYSTANWINVSISICCYIILFLLSPVIADFYEMPIIAPTLRVMTLAFIFGAFAGVSRTKLSKEMKFKKISIATLATSIFSGIIGITMAHAGFGVWALVYQTVLSALFSSVWIISISGFRPNFRFSKRSFIELYSFGGKLLCSEIIWVIYNNIYPLIIGKGFNAQSVGYYTRASSYAQLVPVNFSGILENVLFPAFANIQDDMDRMVRLYRKALMISSCFVFTGNFFLMGLAHPLILNIISEKWLPCVPLLQILCLSTMFGHITSINGRLLIAKGYPGIFLKMSAVTQLLTLSIIFISFWGGIEGLAWGAATSSILGTIYCCHIFKRTIGINPIKCLKDSFKILILSGVIGLGAMISFKYWIAPTICNLLFIFCCMCLLYIGGLKFLTPQILNEIRSIRK